MTEPSRAAALLLHAAFHEAAHLVAHQHLSPSDLPVEVAIFTDGQGLYDPGEPGPGDASARGRVVAILAGPAADARLAGRTREAIAPYCKQDARRASDWLERLGEGESLERHRAGAERFVRDHWRQIEVMAAVLLQVGTLRGDVARMVLDLANGAAADAAAARLRLPPTEAQATMLAFAFRLSPTRVSEVLSGYGYRAPAGDVPTS